VRAAAWGLLLALWCVAVVVGFALLAGCQPVEPYGTWAERPDTAIVTDISAHDIAAPHDQFTGLWCVQALGDGGRDALAAGEPCDIDSADRCAPPVSCSFDSFDYEGRCEVSVNDGPAETRCCQYAKTHSMVDGRVQQCRNCGDGWRCSG